MTRRKIVFWNDSNSTWYVSEEYNGDKEDFAALENSGLNDDFAIYKAFDGKKIESIILFAVLCDEKLARHYLDDLRGIKIATTGKHLEAAGFEPSPKYKEIFDFLLNKKLKNPKMTLENEMALVKEFF